MPNTMLLISDQGEGEPAFEARLRCHSAKTTRQSSTANAAEATAKQAFFTYSIPTSVESTIPFSELSHSAT